MKQYSQEFKDNITARMFPPNNVGIPQLAQETGVPRNTLYAWRIKHRKSQGESPAAPVTASGGLSSEEKFAVVIQCATLNEVELSEYCRSKGVFPEQVHTWREACLQANAVAAPKVDRAQIRTQAKQIKALEAELGRKDKALAETAALLVLQKKVQAIWGKREDEKLGCGSVSR